MIISRTNYRISIFGGGTDTSDFYTKHGSYIIGFGLNHHVYVMANYINKVDNVCYQAFYSKSEKVININEFQNPSIYGSFQFLQNKFGTLPYLSIHINNTLPSSCGIGSSSALICGILNAVSHLLKNPMTKQEIAEACNIIERQILKEPGGIQDPYWCCFSNIGELNIDITGKVNYNNYLLSKDFIADFKQNSIIFYLSQRPSFQVSKSYFQNGEKHKLKLLDIAKAGKEAIQNENITEISRLLDENWQEKRQISSLISNSQIDEIYEVVRQRGGSMKICGAGGGGAIFCMCPKNQQDNLIKQLNLPVIPMDIDTDGTHIIFE